MKHSIVESAREVCGSVRAGGKNLKIMWWNNEIKLAVKKKEVLVPRDEEAKERRMVAYREEKG